MQTPLVLLLTLLGISAAIAWLFWPHQGLFWGWRRTRKLTRRVLIEDALKHLHDCEYHDRTPTVQSLAGALRVTDNEITDILTDMQTRGLVQFEQNRFSLSPMGQTYALQIIRAHRLWERYLADKTGVPEAEWHARSEEREHQLTPTDIAALSDELGHPRFDPHGDPIPTAQGELALLNRQSLAAFPLYKPARIVHLEDEPEAIYAQLLAEGLFLGMTIRVTEVSAQRIRFWANGEEHILAPLLAANVSLVAVEPEEAAEPEHGQPLTTLKPGQAAQVAGISRICRGAERRRLMDLGILPGTVIKAELISPSGDPTAYLIRGALIGLRREQAGMILVTDH